MFTTTSTSALHGHICQECRFLRTCLQSPCPSRGRDRETNWICFVCRDAAANVANEETKVREVRS